MAMSETNEHGDRFRYADLHYRTESKERKPTNVLLELAVIVDGASCVEEGPAR